MHRRFVIFAGLALLGGCATAAPIAVPPAAASFGELEPLYAATAGRDAVIIRVSSNGCTRKDDFAFFVERKGEEVGLAFGRKRLDPCRSFAMGQADLSFSYEELGVAPHARLLLLNPITAWTGPER